MSAKMRLNAFTSLALGFIPRRPANGYVASPLVPSVPHQIVSNVGFLFTLFLVQAPGTLTNQ